MGFRQRTVALRSDRHDLTVKFWVPETGKRPLPSLAVTCQVYIHREYDFLDYETGQVLGAEQPASTGRPEPFA